MHTLVLLKIRFTRREIDITCRAELTGGLKDIGFLTVKELDLLHVIQGETPQVHLSVLSIAKLNTIIINRGMLASHRPYIDRLDTSHSAVVF